MSQGNIHPQKYTQWLSGFPGFREVSPLVVYKGSFISTPSGRHTWIWDEDCIIWDRNLGNPLCVTSLCKLLQKEVSLDTSSNLKTFHFSEVSSNLTYGKMLLIWVGNSFGKEQWKQYIWSLLNHSVSDCLNLWQYLWLVLEVVAVSPQSYDHNVGALNSAHNYIIVSCGYVIGICNILCWCPTGKINGEESWSSQMVTTSCPCLMIYSDSV